MTNFETFSRMYRETAKEMEFMAKQQFTFENEVNATVLGKFTDFFQVRGTVSKLPFDLMNEISLIKVLEKYESLVMYL